jgi:hypothetical protein
MDDLTQRALIRSLSAFAGAALVGLAGVWVVGQLNADQGGAVSTPAATASVSVPGGPGTPADWLAWVPGGLPDGFGPQVTTIPEITSATTATADIAWMTSSRDASGTVVDHPPDPYMIPIDTTGIEPTFASFIPDPERTLIQDLQPGQAILSETEATLRGIGQDGVMTFEGGHDITVVGTLPDVFMGGYEMLVLRATGEDIGVTHERYILFQVRPAITPSPDELASKLQPLLPLDVPSAFAVVEVRAPGQTVYLRANDRELPVELLKERFGEFAATPAGAPPGEIRIDPKWVQKHIVSADLPVLGTVQCNGKVVGLLKQAMFELKKNNEEGLVTDIGDCYQPIASPDDPEGPLTARAFGGSIDLNPRENQPGDTPNQPETLVQTMFHHGFGWGGKDAYPQGALFRYRSTKKTTA